MFAVLIFPSALELLFCSFSWTSSVLHDLIYALSPIVLISPFLFFSQHSIIEAQEIFDWGFSWVVLGGVIYWDVTAYWRFCTAHNARILLYVSLYSREQFIIVLRGLWCAFFSLPLEGTSWFANELYWRQHGTSSLAALFSCSLLFVCAGFPFWLLFCVSIFQYAQLFCSRSVGRMELKYAILHYLKTSFDAQFFFF